MSCRLFYHEIYKNRRKKLITITLSEKSNYSKSIQKDTKNTEKIVHNLRVATFLW